jgi:hypothetical protein
MTALWCSYGCLVFLLSLSLHVSSAQTTDTPPQLNGAHFRITALEEHGFLDMTNDANGNVVFSGYLIDMLDAISQSDRANFTYTLLPPSGYGSLCLPRLVNDTDTDDTGNATTNTTTTTNNNKAYDSVYQTQYNCGASDVNDLPLTSTSTDMYLGMYYVTPSRQLQNQFTINFLPPFSSTLAMFGTATGIPNFESLVKQQEAGNQPAACAPGGSALIDFVQDSFPGLQVKDLFGGEEDILQAFDSGECKVYITDRPIAAQFVLRRSKRGECMANGMPIGVIGEPMKLRFIALCHWHSTRHSNRGGTDPQLLDECAHVM